MTFHRSVSFTLLILLVLPIAAEAASKYWSYDLNDVEVTAADSAGEAREIALNLHRLDLALASLLKVQPETWRPVTRVYAVPGATFDSLVKKTTRPVLSYSFPSEFDNEILLNASADKTEPLVGVYGGYTTSLLAGAYSFRYPYWYVNGLTELLAASRVARKQVVVGSVAPERIRSLSTDLWIPLRSLLSIARNDPQLESAYFADRFNAECWFLVHMIVIEEKHRADFNRYFQRSDDGESPAEAFAQSFDVSLEAVDTEMQNALRLGQVKVLKITLPDDPATAEPRLLTDAQAQGRLALFAAKHGTLADPAIAWAKVALTLDPEQEDALDALALAELRQEDYPAVLHAADRLCGSSPSTRTVATPNATMTSTAPTAARCATLYADLLYRGAANDHALGIDAAELAARSREFFNATIAANPEDLASWTGLMSLTAHTKDVDGAKSLLPRAKHLWATHSNNPAVAEWVGNLCTTAGDYDSALRFAQVWQKHAWTASGRASADATIARLKTFMERKQFTETAAPLGAPPAVQPSR
jgi:tetratricopeptide (TPR) repeat protein